MVFPQPTNITSFEGAFQYANTVTGGVYFGPIILIVIFIISFLAMKLTWPTEQAFAATMFLVSIASGILFIVEILSGFWTVLTILVFAGSAVMLYISKS